ncbi:Nif11-like leader peptide family natural product precursor [Microcoleus sp. herbarium12]|uniref:Nif11-like leader peptide family natural product precursor n=1 Tax=Microcoleus sp. herbarium12 TaxID=3055437 RepID=UPI002FD0ED0F
MSIASLTQFQNEVMQDETLQEQFKTAAATSPESLGELAVKLGAERGYSFTLEDVQATVEAASSNSSVEEELTEQELEMVSGGVTWIAAATVGVLAAANGVKDTLDKKK